MRVMSGLDKNTWTRHLSTTFTVRITDTTSRRIGYSCTLTWVDVRYTLEWSILPGCLRSFHSVWCCAECLDDYGTTWHRRVVCRRCCLWHLIKCVRYSTLSDFCPFSPLSLWSRYTQWKNWRERTPSRRHNRYKSNSNNNFTYNSTNDLH